jgi:IS5 family transposase
MDIIWLYNENPWRKAMINLSYPKQTLGIPGFHPYDGGKSPKLKAKLEKSWAEHFRNEVLPIIPAGKIAKECFCSTNGRPSKDTRVTIGLMIIQEMFNLTDRESVDALSFDSQVHHALRIDELCDDLAYMTRETFWSFKEKIRSKGLESVIFDAVSMELARMHKVDTSRVRLDSVNIKSNMKTLTRGGLFFKTVGSFLDNLKKSRRSAFDSIDGSVLSRYQKAKTGYDYFGGVKPTERRAVLQSMAEDVLMLVRKFQDDEAVSNMSSFKLLNRLFQEQCKVVEAADDDVAEKVELKEPKEVSADSLQNPSDPDAGFDRHKPEGRYQAQLAETFVTDGEDGGQDNNLRLVLHVAAESAAKHDSHAVEPAIEDLEAKGAKPDTLLADAAYGGDGNVEHAASKGVRLVSPVPGGKAAAGTDGGDKASSDLTLADFGKDEQGGVVSCPEGQKADTCRNKDGEGYISSFDLEKCKACPVKDRCPVKVGKRKASITYTEKAARIADRRKAQESLDFKKLYRKRSGIEATNSELARKNGIKHLRVRGKKAVVLAVTFKVLALNVRRAAYHTGKNRY